ncbi:polyadenylate-binding protein [Trifolium pratense]|uniref:Polyadenylate-binding protein n=1 Tax=Trifolium pratense TaxID=57577 RepID=A0A2K3PEM4_TRIPR|nr:polyadenylate-binding protein [Trifolium pratense]
MSSVETLTAPQFLRGSPNLSSAQTKPSAWQRPSMGHHISTSNGTIHAFRYSSLPFERHYGFFPKSSETSLMNNVGYSWMSLGNNDGNYMLNAALLDFYLLLWRVYPTVLGVDKSITMVAKLTTRSYFSSTWIRSKVVKIRGLH